MYYVLCVLYAIYMHYYVPCMRIVYTYYVCIYIHMWVRVHILCIHTYMSRSAYRTQKIMPRFARQWQRDTALLSGFADCLARCSANE